MLCRTYRSLRSALLLLLASAVCVPPALGQRHAPRTSESLAVPGQAAATAQASAFSPTGSLAVARDSHTATLLPNGKVLIAGGFRIDPVSHDLVYLTSAELYDPATGTFSATGNLATGRAGHTATLLPNGKVLITGGANFNVATGYVRSAELYDPATGLFTPTGSLLTARNRHTATLLQNGKVLIAGGKGSDSRAFSPAVGPAELYDPASSTFSSTGSLAVLRLAHTATLLPNGNVLIAGGFNPDAYVGVLASAELYDSAAGSFSVIGSLGFAREEHTATLLQNGKVLITAGLSSGYLTSAELYDPLFVSANPPSASLKTGSLVR